MYSLQNHKHYYKDLYDLVETAKTLSGNMTDAFSQQEGSFYRIALDGVLHAILHRLKSYEKEVDDAIRGEADLRRLILNPDCAVHGTTRKRTRSNCQEPQGDRDSDL